MNFLETMSQSWWSMASLVGDAANASMMRLSAGEIAIQKNPRSALEITNASVAKRTQKQFAHKNESGMRPTKPSVKYTSGGAFVNNTGSLWTGTPKFSAPKAAFVLYVGMRKLKSEVITALIMTIPAVVGRSVAVSVYAVCFAISAIKASAA